MPGIASNPETVNAGFCAVADADLTPPIGRAYLQRSTVYAGAEPQCRGQYRHSETEMFSHAGFRPLWPVILFLPWFLVGMAWLLRSLLPGERRVHQPVQVHSRAPLSPRRSLKRT